MNIIPSIGQSFTFVASEIYYDRFKFERVYDSRKEDEEVEKNGIRCAYDDYLARILNKGNFKYL